MVLFFNYTFIHFAVFDYGRKGQVVVRKAFVYIFLCKAYLGDKRQAHLH